MLIRCKSCFCEYDEDFGVCPKCGYYEGTETEIINQLPIGTVLNNRYVIGKVLGFGGFGITYKAWDNKLASALAIKEYFPSGFVNRNPSTNEVIVFSGKRKVEYEYGLSRFLDEARNMAKFSDNNNIVNAYEYFEANNTAYIAMEFLDGMTLSEYMHTTQLSLEQSVDIALKVSSALKDIHSEGILHRDVSPDNIFICNDGKVKIIDFGAARLSSTEDKLRTIVLKPGFAPPEQYESVSVQGPWTDIYALGATLYYLVTGTKPEESTNRRTKDTLKSPIEVNPLVPENVSNSIMKAMALDRHLRFNSCEDFSKALVNEKKVVPLKLEIKRRKRNRILGVTAALLVISVVTALFSTTFRKEKKENTLPKANIEIWYLIDNNEYETERKSAFENITASFCEAYDTVTINLVGVPASEYIQRFNEAVASNKTPAIFDSTLISDDKGISIELNDTLKEISKDNNHYILDEYIKTGVQTKAPLGFVMPMVFQNTKLSKQNFESISLEEINALKSGDIAITTDSISTFGSIFGSSFNASGLSSPESFYSQESAFLFTYSSEFAKVNSKLAGKYRIVNIDTKSLPCKPCNLFSISSKSENEITVSTAFLKYLYSAKSQDILHTDGKTMSFPVNKTAFSSFVEVYSQLNITEDRIKKITIIF